MSILSKRSEYIYLRRWSLKPEYNPANPRCFTIFFAVLKVPLFWYVAATARPCVGSEILELFRSAIRTDTWALSLVNSKGPELLVSKASSNSRVYSHATTVMKEPAVAPAAPKHATVENVG
jgi:hypothetical protein